jgi:hypothetical protein
MANAFRRGRRYSWLVPFVWRGFGWDGCVHFTRFPWRHWV